MGFSFSDLNFNSAETLPGSEARVAFTVSSVTVFGEELDIVPTIVEDALPCVLWMATIRCRSACSYSTRKPKHRQFASVSIQRSATVRGLNLTLPTFSRPPSRLSMTCRNICVRHKSFRSLWLSIGFQVNSF